MLIQDYRQEQPSITVKVILHPQCLVRLTVCQIIIHLQEMEFQDAENGEELDDHQPQVWAILLDAW
jgi:hypothetical protein